MSTTPSNPVQSCQPKITDLLPCPFCKKPPGTKVGPPAMARCITPGCEGTKLAADAFAEWNIHANGAARSYHGTPIKAAAEPSREDLINHMVDRFLGWRLPENFNPDAGISFKAAFNEHTDHPMKHEPIGTNLFDATQSDAMVRYMIEGLPAICLAAAPAGNAGVREEVDEDALWALASALHSNVPEEQRPMSWGDFSPEQIERLHQAANAFLVALALPQPREAEPVAAALARRLCQMFDSGGESQRSARARHASAIFQLLNRDTPTYLAEQNKCDDDFVGYLESVERALKPQDGGK